jgi:hypothetical protein
MTLSPTETELTGAWEIVDGRVRPDSTCERIDWLIVNCLQRIAVTNGGWARYLGILAMVVIGNEPNPWVKCGEAVHPRSAFWAPEKLMPSTDSHNSQVLTVLKRSVGALMALIGGLLIVWIGL